MYKCPNNVSMVKNNKMKLEHIKTTWYTPKVLNIIKYGVDYSPTLVVDLFLPMMQIWRMKLMKSRVYLRNPQDYLNLM